MGLKGKLTVGLLAVVNVSAVLGGLFVVFQTAGLFV